jgi:hypothetical protein
LLSLTLPIIPDDPCLSREGGFETRPCKPSRRSPLSVSVPAR